MFLKQGSAIRIAWALRQGTFGGMHFSPPLGTPADSRAHLPCASLAAAGDGWLSVTVPLEFSQAKFLLALDYVWGDDAKAWSKIIPHHHTAMGQERAHLRAWGITFPDIVPFIAPPLASSIW